VEQTSDVGKVEVVDCDSDRYEFVDSVKLRGGAGAEWTGVE